MRIVAVGMLPLLAVSCGAKYKPHDAVMSSYTRSFKFPVERPHEGLAYTGRNPGTTAPVPPLLAFGAAFDLDYVLMTNSDDFEMIEFGKLSLPRGPEWVVLETNATNGDQVMLSNMDDLASLMPEIPVARMVNDLVVTDASSEFNLDTKFTYTNSKGQKVAAEIAGDAPEGWNKKRNGNTFDHSANSLMAVLDVAATESLFTGNVSIDGNGVGLTKVAGIVPGRFVLVQAMGGLGSGAYKIVPGEPASGGKELGMVVVNKPGEESTVKAPPEMMVRMAVAQKAEGLQACWTARFDAQTDLTGGKMTWEFDVNSGVVSNAAPALETGDGVFVDEQLAQCVAAAINGWALDSSVTGHVSWPFTFVAGDPDADLDASVNLGVGTFVEPGAATPEATEGMPMEGGVEATSASMPGSVDELLDEDLSAVRPKPEGTLQLANFTSIHYGAGGGTVELQWLVTRQGSRVLARQTTDLRSLEYEYRVVGEAYLELVSITVEQFGRATPVTSVTFNPPIPDVRWPFNGKRTSDFVIDVNGQLNHAVGEVEAYWTESGPKVKVIGKSPSWVANRPLLSNITFVPDGSVEVKIDRTGE